MYQAFFKRACDGLFGALLLLVLLPLLLLIAILIITTSPGPALFQQTRVGYQQRRFTIYKFRTMFVDNDVTDSSAANRTTKLGALLRKLSLDELPQLINIVRGDMSFIGPRPWIPQYTDAMTPCQLRRYEVRPGVTGLAQSRGRNYLSIFEKIEFDLEYVSRVSPSLDLKILGATLRTLLSKGSLPEISKAAIHSELTQLRLHNHI